MPRTTHPDDQTGPVSIQGERQRARQAALWASDSEVAIYVQGQPDGVVDCRERGRHQYPGSRLALSHPDAPPFTDITPEGWYVREIGCESCRKVNDDGTPGMFRVIRIEHWHLLHNSRGVIKEGGAQLVRAHPKIVDPAYLNPPGQGRIKPRSVRGAVMSAALKGVNVNTLTREIREHQAEQAQLVREAYERTLLRRAEQDAAQLRLVNHGDAS
jgi:hypothetical protein